jgi:hypothetical protein
LPQLSIPQINSLKARLKIENGQKEKGGFEWRKMLEWCRSHSNIPDDECEVFCVDIDYELLKVKDKDVLKYLRIFISTKRLLSLAMIKSYLIFFSHIFYYIIILYYLQYNFFFTHLSFFFFYSFFLYYSLIILLFSNILLFISSITALNNRWHIQINISWPFNINVRNN